MNFREIQQLQNRINKIQKIKQPPRLRCVVLNPGEKIPDDIYVRSTTRGEVEMVQDPFSLLIQMRKNLILGKIKLVIDDRYILI